MKRRRLSAGNYLIHWRPPICWNCKHRDPKQAKCSAFPDGIPAKILTNEVDHRLPFHGDRGIRFEPKEQ